MAKDDVLDMPAAPPRKRRAIEGLPDVWIAKWLADEGALAPSDVKRLRDEKDRRKRLKPDVIVGVIVGNEGMTPEQSQAIKEAIRVTGATGFRYVRVAGSLHAYCKKLAPVERESTLKDVVRAADVVVAAPKELREPSTQNVSPVWEAVRLARHRSTPIKIAMPDGSLN